MKNRILAWAIQLCVAAAVVSTGFAAVVDTETLILPNDQENNKDFGFATSISGNTAVVGAQGDAGGRGAAYVFTGSGANWTQQQKLVPPESKTNDLVGTSVSIDGDLLAIGAPGFPANIGNTNPGAVFIYQRTGGTWVEQARLTTPDPQAGDRFGISVAISGSNLVVGANLHGEVGRTNCGAIYVFELTSLGWTIRAKLVPTDLTSNSFFGSSVDISGDTIIAGAPDSFSSAGAAYVFVHHGMNPMFATWDFQQKLTPGNPINAEQFGFSVAVNGNNAVVGAPFTSSGGTAYAFMRSGTVWSQQAQLLSSDLAQGDNFGWSVAVLGTRAVIGAEAKNSNNVEGVGAAYIFDQNGNIWTQQQKLLPLVSGGPVTFGFAVDIGTQAIIVGAPFFFGASGTGLAFIFTSSQAPVLITSASASPSVLWPPNHKLVPVTISVTTTGNPATSKIVSVSSNQPINGTGDGNTSPDWVITGDLTVSLRGERAGNIKTDRVYTITVESTDALGNTARKDVFVTVPHDQGK